MMKFQYICFLIVFFSANIVRSTTVIKIPTEELESSSDVIVQGVIRHAILLGVRGLQRGKAGKGPNGAGVTWWISIVVFSVTPLRTILSDLCQPGRVE